MHICIPDTREVKPQHGAAYLLYNIHIDGLYHCSLRYKQLLHLHQLLTKKFNNAASSNHSSYQLPQFPPKKLLPLSNNQVEERRMQLEKYLQYISQDKLISSSPIFNLFLLEAQRESTRIKEKHVHLDIELVNGQKIRLPILTYDSADGILKACCRALGLSDRYHAYFCLCLCGYDVVRDKLIIKRRLSFNEAPFITLQMAIQQQEQLQSVLSSSIVNSTQNSNNSLREDKFTAAATSVCHCLSCCQQQHQLQQQQRLQSITTGVPLVGSSSSSSASSATTTSDLFVNSDSNDDSGLGHYNNNNNNSLCNSECQYNWQQQLTNENRHQDDFRTINNDNCRSFVTHRILLRKSYWDPIYDSYILNDQQALNLLFIQTVYDMKHSLMFVDRDTYHQLETLLARDMKLEYILLARTLKYYNYVHFEPCYSDYPRPRTKVMISIGSKELNMRVLKSPASKAIRSNNSAQSPDEPVLYCTSSLVPSEYQDLVAKDDIVEEEYNFKVPLIRCWRLTSLETLNSNVASNKNLSASKSNRNSFVSSPVATTTLAGGKRRSLSLFNSIVGNSPPNRANHNQHANSISGSDGNSILAALATINPNDNTNNGSSLNTNSSLAATAQSERRQQLRNFTNNNHQQNGDSNSSTMSGNHDHHLQQQQQRCDGSMAASLRQDQPMSQYELSFEYLISKDTLKWITISSDQAIFISISLQGVVDELVSKREGACYAQPDQRQRPPVSSASQWPLYFNPSPPRSDQTTTQLIPPLYPSGNRSNALMASPNCDGKYSAQHPQQQSEQSVESFAYMHRDGSQRQLISRAQHYYGEVGSARASQQRFSASAGSEPRQVTRESRALTLIPSFWTSMSATSSPLSPDRNSNQQFAPQEQQSGARLFSASSSSSSIASSSSTSAAVRKLSNGSLANGHSGSKPMEITRLPKKAPSPILNDAFEGAINHDDELL